MKVLFVGGSGIISSACSELAVRQGVELYHLNRGQSPRKIDGVKSIVADIRNPAEAKKALENQTFDVVVDWVAFVPEHIRNDLTLFREKTGQFVFISSASAYQKPPRKLPVTEETPLENPFWQYSRDKIACENLLMDEYRKTQFPVTIVRPSHTYDKTLLPIDWGYTGVDRMKNGRKIVVHGDGTSLWTLTNHRDFAVGFNGLLGNDKALGEAVHITSDESLPWNQIYELLAAEMDVRPDVVHVPSDFIAKIDPNVGAGLLGDKAHSMIFDNAKIRRLVPAFRPKIPFAEGAKEIMKWYKENPSWQVVKPEVNQLIDRIIAEYGV